MMKKTLLFLPLLLALVTAAALTLRAGLFPAEAPPPPVRTLEQAIPPQPEPEPEPAAPAGWKLTLVSPEHPLPEDYAVTLTRLKNGQAVDERCYPALQEMMDACRAEGLEPLICSSYRTWEKQTRLFENKVARFAAGGLSPEAARAEAARVVAVPGTSEHHLGLAVDIVDSAYQLLDDAQADTPVQQWLMAHAWEYGFVLRYPREKEDVTGIVWEPWHYRYVGKEAAEEMTAQQLCLEEYLDARSGGSQRA